MTEAALRLARALSDRQWCSGQAIAQQLGISRAAVWKQVDRLRGLGVQVQAQRGRGYRLNDPLQLLDKVVIEQTIDPARRSLLTRLDIVAEVDSTNSELLRRPRERRHGVAVLAERQSAGRGRRGRHWHSPFAQNIYLSLGWRFDGGHGGLGFVPLVVALAAQQAVSQLGAPGVMIKWPNDLLMDGAKLGGCLVEVQGDISGPSSLVIGVGLNVLMHAAAGEAAIDQPFAALADALPEADRNEVAGHLLDQLFLYLTKYAEHGFEPFQEQWSQCDALAGKPVTVHAPGGAVAGVARGVGKQGGLLLDIDGQVVEQHSGEVSVRLGATADGPGLDTAPCR